MDRIFPPTRARTEASHGEFARHGHWHDLCRNPLVQAWYRLLVILIVCAWPVLKWFVLFDVLLELTRAMVLGGFAVLRCLLHFAVIGVVAYFVAFVPPLPPR